MQLASPQSVRLQFETEGPPPNARARYNGAPSQDFMLVRCGEDGLRRLSVLRWGLIPRWCKDPKGGTKPINARAETVATLPTFREAYRKRRALLPIDGYYEWRAIKGAKAKQPYAFAMADRSPFALAALWEAWTQPDSGELFETFCVLTTTANSLAAEIHDRMPVIVSPADYERWLGAEPDPRELLRPFPPERMVMWPVSTRVNSPRNDDEELLEAVAAE